MRNEEKILSILEHMQDDITGMKTDMAGMQGDITDMKTDMANMQGDITSLKTGQIDLQKQIDKLDAHVAKEHDITRSELKTEIDYAYKELKDDVNTIEIIVAKKWYDVAKNEIMEGLEKSRVME